MGYTENICRSYYIRPTAAQALHNACHGSSISSLERVTPVTARQPRFDMPHVFIFKTLPKVLQALLSDYLNFIIFPSSLGFAHTSDSESVFPSVDRETNHGEPTEQLGTFLFAWALRRMPISRRVSAASGRALKARAPRRCGMGTPNRLSGRVAPAPAERLERSSNLGRVTCDPQVSTSRSSPGL